MSDWGWKPYVSVAERRRKAEKAAVKAKKAGANLSPIAPIRGAIARTFWGKAWCDNLERYGDYANRLPRGRTYARNGAVIDLAIGPGEVRAQVMGSRLYRVEVRVAAVAKKHWNAIGTECVGSIDSMIELLQGTFSNAVMQRLCRSGDGLFPAPKEIEFTCSCPDWASMCKHVAAVLYGVGARLDQRPELLFELRRVESKDLLAQAGAGLAKPTKVVPTARVLDKSALADVFGIEMADDATPAKSTKRTAGKGAKAAAGAVTADSTNMAKGKAKSSSGQIAGAKGDAGNYVAARTAAKSKARPKTRRQTSYKDDLPPSVTATGKAAALRTKAPVNQKPKRKIRA